MDAAKLDLNTLVRGQQVAWARRSEIEVDSQGYCRTKTANFGIPLSAEATAELQAGDGGELSDTPNRDKIQALHSSSALACNFFEYWRHQADRSPLAAALMLPASINSVRFERKFATGVRGRNPNLDVVLALDSGVIVAVESKFLEPYAGEAKGWIRDSYVAGAADRWSEAGLPGCQQLVGSLREGEISFKLLDAAQLLKHMLGLANVLNREGTAWRLCYLYYAPKHEAARRHSEEVERFATAIGADRSHFSSMTYQEAFVRMRPLLPGHAAYATYLQDRYFS